MIKLNKTILTLVGILILAIFFRFYQLSSVPPSASLDEVSLGWNAYSILQTGKDEYGNIFPILLRAYDDWRPALYVYFVIPFIKLFGLNVLSVRLPSVIFSVLTIIAAYFLVKELFKVKPREFPDFFNGNNLGLGTAFLLAISPWHIYISRLGHEVNLGLSFLVFGVLFFIKKEIYLSALFFLLSFVSYQTEKIFIPILLIGTFFIFKSDILNMRKKILVSIIISLTALTPFIKESLKPSALIRFTGTNVFESSQHRFIEQSLLLKKAVLEKDIIGQIVYNRRFITAQIFAEGYLSHFDPLWLFTNPSGDRHKIPDIGLLYLIEVPLVIIGIYILIKYRFNTKSKKLIWLWFFTAPIAASLTTETPHALRSLVFLPTWQIFSALGLLFILTIFKKKFIKRIVFTSFAAVFLFSVFYLYKQYFFVFPKEHSHSFQYSLYQAIPEILKLEGSYDKIIFSNENRLGQSYMFFLFYSRYNPKFYQGSISGGYGSTHKFGKYEFRPFRILDEEGDNNLYIGNVLDFPKGKEDVRRYKKLKVIKELNRQDAIIIATK